MRADRSVAAVFVATLVAVLLPAPTASASGQSGGKERLSVPGVLSRWGFVKRPVVARVKPVHGAGVVGRLGLRTEDGTDELVLALARTRGEDGRRWVKVRLPVRPVGSTGWIPMSALEPLVGVRTWLRVDTRRLRATLVRSGRIVFRARVAVGRSRWPTPRGDFYSRNKLVGVPAGTVYGALAFGTSAKSDVLTDCPRGAVIGVHGTNRPELIPGRVSHGCIRMRNRDILRLARLMPVGTPLSIR